MQALIWLQMVPSNAIQFGIERFSASYVNLRQPHIFKHQRYGRNLVLHSSKYSIYLVSQTHNTKQNCTNQNIFVYKYCVKWITVSPRSKNMSSQQ